jgi:hypothetical protein
MESSDSVAQMTFMGADDKAWRAEKRRTVQGRAQRKRMAETPPPMPDGPCCGRCALWLSPLAGESFGSCRYLAVVAERSAGGPERGTIMSLAQARSEGWTWEPLAVRGFAEGCSVFHPVEPTT